MRWNEPPVIFPIPLYDVEQTIINKQGCEPETYALFFIRRQVYLGLPESHPWVADDTYDVGYQSCHGGITYSSDCLPDKTTRKDMWFIGYDYSHSANCDQHNTGFSYDKVYDSSCQDEVIQEAKIMMQTAIAERVKTMDQEYKDYLIHVLDKINELLPTRIVTNESKSSSSSSSSSSSRSLAELTKCKKDVDNLIESLSEAMEKIAKVYGVLSKNTA